MKLFQLHITVASIVLAVCTLASSATAAPTAFNNFGVFSTVESSLVGTGRFSENPFPWFEGDTLSPMTGWDASVQWDWSFVFTDAFAPVSDADPLFIAAPFVSESTIIAKDDDGNTIGTLSMTGTGVFDTNLNESEALIDPVSAQVFTPYSLLETYEITGRTGLYTGLVEHGEWSTEVQGRASRPLFSNQDLIGGPTTNSIITASSTFVIQGEFDIVPEPSTASGLLPILMAAMFLRRGPARQLVRV